MFFPFIRNIAIALALCGLCRLDADPDFLKANDVSKIMQQILSQHLDQKEVTTAILKKAFKVYIDQFDPDRIYLLDQEVEPYLKIDDQTLAKIQKQYQRNDFSAFEKLNDTIQIAILRARAYRTTFTSQKAELFTAGKNFQNEQDRYEEWRDPDLKMLFAKTPQELQGRIRHHLIRFIDAERTRFGDEAVIRNADRTLAIYDVHMRDMEDQYLFQDDSRKALAADQKENLFILHVLKSLASSLDAHTTFFNPAEAYDMKVRLEKGFDGIGVVLKQSKDGHIVVTHLVPGGPAEKSGKVKVGDTLVQIDHKPVAGEPFEKIMDSLRGKNGTTTSLVLKRTVADGAERGEKELQVDLKREAIAVAEDRVDINYEKFGDSLIGKITLHSFYQGDNGITSENDVRDAIKQLSKKGNLRGLILDLRENSGGFLTQAVKVAGLFITNGVIVISKYSNGDERFYRDMDGKTLFDGPLIILTSKATASAAEIVAQALQDYGVALIVGDEQTYGKGTIQSQTVTENKGGSFFKVTVGKYYTVSGKTPQIQGVKADIIVPSQFNKEHIGEEYLEYALTQDTIPSAYKDSLEDVEPGLKAWFLRYYVPTVQHKSDTLRKMLPLLKKNSASRISNNNDYQIFLQILDMQSDGHRMHRPNFSKQDVSRVMSKDLQMNEAVNIMKDMITIESQERTRDQVMTHASIGADRK